MAGQDVVAVLSDTERLAFEWLYAGCPKSENNPTKFSGVKFLLFRRGLWNEFGPRYEDSLRRLHGLADFLQIKVDELVDLLWRHVAEELPQGMTEVWILCADDGRVVRAFHSAAGWQWHPSAPPGVIQSSEPISVEFWMPNIGWMPAADSRERLLRPAASETAR